MYYLYRYYDPLLQRWINRDPIAENGGLNVYQFVANNPTTYRDHFGHQPIPNRPNEAVGDPNVATVACDGKGDYKIYGVKNAPMATKSCIKQHEQQHIDDLKAKFGENSCKGVPEGNIPIYDKEFLDYTECKAYKREINCLSKACHKNERERQQIKRQKEGARARLLDPHRHCDKHLGISYEEL